MPRRKPTQIIEHRLSLSDYERSALKEFLIERQRIERLNAGSGVVASVGGVAVSGWGVFLIGVWLAQDIVPDIIDKVGNAMTLMQRRCPEAIAAADTKIANYEARINSAESAGGDTRFIAAERAKLDKIKVRRNRLANLCEWGTIAQEYPDLDTEKPGFFEIIQKALGSL